MNRIFLTAEWRWLVMLNYEIDPGILRPYVPAGTELDDFNGVTYVSMVGFRFLNTRLLGIAFPFHRDFDEVNLRFYVRAKAGGQWRRGVVFVRELVPRIVIATIARAVYGEPYLAVPMRHSVDISNGVRAEYAWKRKGVWEKVWAASTGEPNHIVTGSEEEFITEHYWGFTRRRQSSSEYEVQHPRWRIWNATEFGFEANVATLYGECFSEALSAKPRSAFIAEGSPISVMRHASLAPR